MVRLFICLLALAGAQAARADADVTLQLRAVEAAAVPLLAACEQLSKDADCRGSTVCVENAIAKLGNSPIHKLYLANLLYKTSPKQSYELHKSVVQAMPNNTNALLEWAIEQHRAREYKGAAASYQAYLKAVPQDAAMWALLADCLVHTGDLAAAVAAWSKAKHAEHHVAIEEALNEVYGPLHPSVERCRLWHLVETGDRGAVDELLVLDTEWRIDWWNQSLNRDALKTDVARTVALTKHADRKAELENYAAIMLAQPNDLATAFKRANWLVQGGSFPPSSQLSSQILNQALTMHLLSATDVQQRFEKELRTRITPPKQDIHALNILAFLLATTGDAGLHAVDEIGYNQYHDVRFAASLLSSNTQLKYNSLELAEALRAFPNSAHLHAVKLELAQKDNVQSIDDLKAAIIAEFQYPVGLLARHDSYRLKKYFAALEKQLQSLPPKH